MTQETISLEQFINDHKIAMTVKPALKNPYINDMPRNFLCTLTNMKSQNTMRVHFSQGSAHTENPTTADVLDCLASDAAGYENSKGFEDWASDYGYDTDSRKAEKTYNAIGKQIDQLKTLLGHAYDQLLYHTERM